VILATALRSYPTQCNFSTFFTPFNEPNYCAVPTVSGDFNSIYSQTFDVEPTDWQVSNEPVNTTTWIDRNWKFGEVMLKNSTGYHGIDLENPSCGESQAGVIYLDSPQIKISVTSTVYVEFEHIMFSDPGYSGGVLYLKVNSNGEWFYWDDGVINKYPSGPLAKDNPLYRADWNTYSGGLDRNSLLPKWGKSIFSYPSTKGDVIQVRFAFGTSTCGGSGGGWDIDNFQVYSCEKEVNKNSKKLSGGQIAGIVIGVVLFAAIVVVGVIVLLRRTRRPVENEPLLKT